MGKLDNKIAVVTGGNSGIGLATAQLFAREGAQVVIFGRNAETVAGAVASLEGRGYGVTGDVSNLADLDRLYVEVQARYGRIDVLFANAGVAFFNPLEAVDEAFFDQQLNVNVKGAYFTVQKAIPLLSQGASVIFTGSAVTEIGMAGATVYSATKAALRSFARTFTAELAPRGIRVNNLSPGPVETPIWGRTGMPDEAIQAMGHQVASQVPLGRFSRPEEQARAVLFLASDDASFVTGTDLFVDGGMAQV